MRGQKCMTIALLTGIAVGILCLIGCKAAHQEEQPVVVQFGWIFDAHHLGFLMADAQGYYKSQGISVKLLPGGLDSSPVRAISTGGANMAQLSGAEQLLSAAEEGLPIVAIAAFHRHSPHAIVSLSRNPIRTVADLRGKTVAVAYGDAAEFLFRGLLQQSNISENQLKLVPFRFDLTPLRQGSVDGITGFSTDQPITLQAEGLHPTVLSYRSLGLDEYGYLFAVTREYATQNAEALSSFIQASRKGWEIVFSQPEKALALLVQKVPDLNVDAERGKLEALRPLMLSPDGKLAEWDLDPQVIKATESRMLRFGGLKSQLDTNTVIDNQFNPAGL